MLIGNEPAPWQYYVKQYPGMPMEQLKQRYLAEQLQYFRQVEQMQAYMASNGGASQPVQNTTSTTTTTTTAAPTTTTTTAAPTTTTSTTTTTTTV
jgi:hypothetical protein